MLGVFSNLLDVNKKEVNRLAKRVEEVNDLEKKAKKVKNNEFAKRSEEFKKRLEDGETLEDLLPEAFSLVREVSLRKLGMRPYDVQIMSAIALFEGKVAEQKTGEGKTLSAVLPLYLRGLAGKGAHLVTVNDYLAKRDAGWNAPVFHALGLSVGVIASELTSFVYDPEYSDTSYGDERLAHLKPVERKEAYAADITYCTKNEFGFDYLRDNMVRSLEQMSQRGHYFAIVDEVDSVLIDEARTPLIISQPDTEPTGKYLEFAKVVDGLNPDTDFTIDEKARSASLTERGIARVEKILGYDNLYEEDYDAVHHIENALKAKTLYLKDRDYVVKEDQVIIVDEFTGRLMHGRRWGDGMHQAVEAKEGVKIQQESKTLATISFQNYFRMYDFLSGMTGTAATEAEEFKKIYNLDVVVIPTHKPNQRDDRQDTVYKTLTAKYHAIVEDIEERSGNGQPVLVGTTSIEKNEIIHEFLKRKKIDHNILNAKNHEKEAMIITEAGKPGAVTVATNMAGRGVDIVLGGSPPDSPPGVDIERHKEGKEYKKWKKDHEKVLAAGGLHVIGTERHESRRIDNQLRGRSGRQGDPGSTRFYLSLEDDLMRVFGGEQIGNLMDRLKLPENQPIENKLISRAIEQAQVKVEGLHFDARKRVVEYDDVVNQQREIIYKLRRRVLEDEELGDEIVEKLEHQVDGIILASTNVEDSKLDAEKAIVGMMEIVPFNEASKKRVKEKLTDIDGEKAGEFLKKVVNDVYEKREEELGEGVMHQVERFAYLGSLDHHWIDHIDSIDALREGVGIRGRNDEERIALFKQDAYDMFEELIDKVDSEIARRIFRIQTAVRRPEIDLSQARTNEDVLDRTGVAGGADLAALAGESAFGESAKSTAPANMKRDSDGSLKKTKKVGRNDPCPCGSGKKYKKCHYPQYG